MIILFLIGALWSGSQAHSSATDDLHLRLYQLSDWTKIQVPPPPLCHIKPLNDSKPIPAQLTLWRLLPHQLVGSGLLYSKFKLVTRCQVNFLGQHMREIIEKIPLAVSTEEALAPLAPSSLEKTVDLTTEPSYKCVWWSTQEHTSIRLQVQSVPVYLAEKGCISANNRVWCETSTKTIWSNGYDLLTAQIHFVDTCMYEPYRYLTGRLYQASNSSYVFLAPSGHYRVVINTADQISACQSGSHHLYTSDIGTPVSLNTTIGTPHPHHLRQFVPSISESSALRLSQEEYANHLNLEAVNHALQTLDSMICANRLEQWTLAHRLKDPNILASYITKDPFAQGKQDKSVFFIRVRSSVDVTVRRMDLQIIGENIIKIRLNGVWMFVGPTSGIISPEPFNSTLLPPYLETPTGGMVDVRTGVQQHIDWTSVGINITDILPIVYEDTHQMEFSDSTSGLDEKTLKVSALHSLFSHHLWMLILVLVFLFSCVIFIKCGGSIIDGFCRLRRLSRRARRPPTPEVALLPVNVPHDRRQRIRRVVSGSRLRTRSRSRQPTRAQRRRSPSARRVSPRLPESASRDRQAGSPTSSFGLINRAVNLTIQAQESPV